MDGKTTVVVEMCPACGSLDVRASEPRWFAIDLDRRADLGAWVERVEFDCRDCGNAWT